MNTALSEDFDPLTILILDDCAFHRARLRRMLRVARIRCQISEVQSLKEFEQALSNEPIAVACLDYDLPDGTGLDALSSLKADARSSKALPILITANQAPHIEREARNLGCFSLLPKPQLKPELLRSVISEGLSRRASIEKKCTPTLVAIG